MIYARCVYGLIVTICLLVQLKAVIYILVEVQWIIYLFKACVLLVLLYGYPAWFPEISDLRKLDQLNIHGLRWCFGYNDYSSLLKLSNSLPMCYQLIERDIRVFTAILNNENCISFHKFFKLDSKVLNLRTLDRERLALTRAKKRCTENSFFFRVERIINDAADAA